MNWWTWWTALTLVLWQVVWWVLLSVGFELLVLMTMAVQWNWIYSVLGEGLLTAISSLSLVRGLLLMTWQWTECRGLKCILL